MGEEKKIAIIGYGMVGKALHNALEEPAYIIDPDFPESDTYAEARKADIIFICVPTPKSQSSDDCDLSIVKDILLRLCGYQGIVVIRSTIPPKTTEALKKIYKLRINHYPEFLTEATAMEDAKYPEFSVIGGDEAKEVGNILKGKIKGDYYYTDSTTAELLKYFMNCFFATKVIFANQFYDIAEKVGANYELIKNIAYTHKWIGKNHLNVLHKGYRGYGGHCLPKDVKALKHYSKLLQLVDKINDRLKRKP